MSILDVIGLIGSLITIGYLLRDILRWAIGSGKPTDDAE